MGHVPPLETVDDPDDDSRDIIDVNTQLDVLDPDRGDSPRSRINRRAHDFDEAGCGRRSVQPVVKRGDRDALALAELALSQCCFGASPWGDGAETAVRRREGVA